MILGYGQGKKVCESRLAQAALATHFFKTARLKEMDLPFTPMNYSTNQCQWGQCAKTFQTVKALYLHVFYDHAFTSRNCFWEDCRYYSSRTAQIRSHIIVHIPYFPYSCEKCDKTVKRKHDLIKHVNSMHSANSKKMRDPVEDQTKLSVDFLLN